jgi:hypothetical protein
MDMSSAGYNITLGTEHGGGFGTELVFNSSDKVIDTSTEYFKSGPLLNLMFQYFPDVYDERVNNSCHRPHYHRSGVDKGYYVFGPSIGYKAGTKDMQGINYSREIIPEIWRSRGGFYLVGPVSGLGDIAITEEKLELFKHFEKNYPRFSGGPTIDFWFEEGKLWSVPVCFQSLPPTLMNEYTSKKNPHEKMSLLRESEFSPKDLIWMTFDWLELKNNLPIEHPVWQALDTIKYASAEDVDRFSKRLHHEFELACNS